jgi:hypothetical protein
MNDGRGQVMAKKLNPAESKLFYEVVKEAEPSEIEISSEQFLCRLKEQQQASLSVNQLAPWLSEDPFVPG